MRVNNSGFYGEKQITSDTHRTLGPQILCTNLDCLEYMYVNGQIVFVAVIDYKEGCAKDIHLGQSAADAQVKLAVLLNLPLFIVLTYLDPNIYPIPMYKVIAENELAKNKMTHINFNPDGEWMSIRRYSHFRHYLRGLIPDKNVLDKLSTKMCQY